jgi:hypothetical protein
MLTRNALNDRRPHRRIAKYVQGRKYNADVHKVGDDDNY